MFFIFSFSTQNCNLKGVRVYQSEYLHDTFITGLCSKIRIIFFENKLSLAVDQSRALGMGTKNTETYASACPISSADFLNPIKRLKTRLKNATLKILLLFLKISAIFTVMAYIMFVPSALLGQHVLLCNIF